MPARSGVVAGLRVKCYTCASYRSCFLEPGFWLLRRLTQVGGTQFLYHSTHATAPQNSLPPRSVRAVVAGDVESCVVG